MAERFEGEIDDLYQKWISSPSAVVGARLADRLRQSGRLDEAAEIANQGLEEWPTNLSLQVVLGRCHLDGGNLEGAREAFTEVRSKDPLNLVALRSLADIAMRQESWDEAVELIEEYLFENPTDDEAEQLLEKAKLARKEQTGPEPQEQTGPEHQEQAGPEPQEQAGPEEDSGPEEPAEEQPAGEGEESGREPPGEPPEEFPETSRMERILAGQTGSGMETDTAESDDSSGPAPGSGVAETSGMRREPRSLLDLFSPEEREDLNLRPFEEGG